MREVFIIYANVKNVISGSKFESRCKELESYPTQSEIKEAISRYTLENGWEFYNARVEKIYVIS